MPSDFVVEIRRVEGIHCKIGAYDLRDEADIGFKGALRVYGDGTRVLMLRNGSVIRTHTKGVD